MKVHRIIGDGNCLFGSCAFLLHTTHDNLRNKVVTVMKEYPTLKINGKTLAEWIEMAGNNKNYPSHVSKNGTWGSGIELALISIMYNRCIRIMKREETKFVQIAEFFPEYEDPMYLLYSGSHYDALTE